MRSRGAQFAQRVGAEGREGQQAIDPEYAMKFGEDLWRRVDPLQRKVAPDEIDATGLQRQRLDVAAHNARGRSSRGSAPSQQACDQRALGDNGRPARGSYEMAAIH